MKGDWKTNAPLVIDDEVVAYVKIAKIMRSTVSLGLYRPTLDGE